MTLRLVTFTTLYPNAAMPNHGIFVETRLRHLIAHENIVSIVIAPVPFFPSQNSHFGRWARLAAAPACETRHRINVRHPRYLAVPWIGQAVSPALLYGAASRTLARLIADGYQPDAIDAHYLYPDGVAAVWLGRRFKLPVVVTARGSDVSEWPGLALPGKLIRRTLREANALIAVSGALEQGMIALGANPACVTVLRNGVDSEGFRPHNREDARSTLGLVRPTIISVGHLIERKGHDRVIEALALLPDLGLMIVGEGPERAKLVALAARLGVTDRVWFTGALPQAELPLYYSAAEALVLASSREGWANVLLEAMACGTPVIASPIWGNPEVVRERAAGLVCRENTPAAIADSLRDLLAAPPARAATRAYAERHGWREISAGQLAVFKQAIADGSRSGSRP
jgi:teichuronic acid biosynthesis glycosyltransferase TuaC